MILTGIAATLSTSYRLELFFALRRTAQWTRGMDRGTINFLLRLHAAVPSETILQSCSCTLASLVSPPMDELWTERLKRCLTKSATELRLGSADSNHLAGTDKCVSSVGTAIA